MKTCQNCGSQFEGSFCTMCGTKSEPFAIVTNPQTESFFPYGKPVSTLTEEPVTHKQVKTNPLLGFRSNKTWKKVISIFYLIDCAIVFLMLITEGKFEGLPMFDFIIKKLTDLFSFIFMISPYIFLSNFSFRKKIPLFNEYKTKSSIIGMAIVLIVTSMLSGIINGFHSDEYNADMTNHSYIITETTEPTKTSQGEIHKQCSFCGKTTIEYTDPYNK
jgi:hypothetical protein